MGLQLPRFVAKEQTQVNGVVSIYLCLELLCFLLPFFIYFFPFWRGGRGEGAIILFPVNLSHLMNLGDLISVCMESLQLIF